MSCQRLVAYLLCPALMWVAAWPPDLTAAGRRTVNDALWIWGHPAGVYNDSYLRSIGRSSTIEPAAAARFMGLSNLIFVCYQGKPQPPFESYYRQFQPLNRVYWSLVAAEGATSQAMREAAFTLAEEHENLVGWILDDFFHEPSEGNADVSLSKTTPGNPSPLSAALTPADLRSLRLRKIRGRSLPLMAVVYTGQLKAGAQSHLAEIDQVCLWTSRPADLKNLEANFAVLEKLAPSKKHLLGCYMYDFFGRKPLPVELMQQQVELGYRWLSAGRIAGMIFLATPNVDVGLEAVDWTRRWIRETGNHVVDVKY